MTRMMIEALSDCTSKISGLTPGEDQIRQMYSVFSLIDRLSEICSNEGPSRIKLEIYNLPETTDYERIFKECLEKWLGGASVKEVTDYATDKYFEAAPAGFNAAIYFASIYGVTSLLKGVSSYDIIDYNLQYLLPEKYRWAGGKDNENDENEDVERWHSLSDIHIEGNKIVDPMDEIRHRFDDVMICDLVAEKDHTSELVGKRIADMIAGFNDGALQLILKELTYPELEKALFAVPKSVEKRIMSNLSSRCIPIIKGDCILEKDSLNWIEVRVAVLQLEEAIKNYKGDPELEAGYED